MTQPPHYSINILYISNVSMFQQNVYINRRTELKQLLKSGIVILFGNNESPCNYPNNGYYPFRQDSSFLYYFGQRRDGLVGVIDIDENQEMLIGDDIDIEDIVWYGSVDSVSDLAAQVGIGCPGGYQSYGSHERAAGNL